MQENKRKPNYYSAEDIATPSYTPALGAQPAWCCMLSPGSLGTEHENPTAGYGEGA